MEKVSRKQINKFKDEIGMSKKGGKKKESDNEGGDEDDAEE